MKIKLQLIYLMLIISWFTLLMFLTEGILR